MIKKSIIYPIKDFEETFGLSVLNNKEISEIIGKEKYNHIIIELNSDNKKWSNIEKAKETILKELKDEIRNVLRKQLKGRCTYCRRIIYRDIRRENQHEHIDHIKPKNKYPNKTIHATNLCLSCSICNIVKGQKEIDFNPYKHKYHENIQIIKPWLYKGLTNEGKKLIESLSLNKISSIEQKKYLIATHIEYIILRSIAILIKSNTSKEDKISIINSLFICLSLINKLWYEL